ncbi:MAG: hypothetical protein Q4G69_10060 [Planctomycetia bacterium]|nr:hypothetical protein [Planctomycetia bacterium]
MKRREFLQCGAALSPLALTGIPVLGASVPETGKKDPPFRFDQPFDGAIVHERYGDPVSDLVLDPGGSIKLKIAISGQIPGAGLQVELINAKEPQKKLPVKINGTRFTSEAILSDTQTEFIATLLDSQKAKKGTIRTRVIWIKNSYPRYRFQVDDNIFFLQDIAKKKYKTLMDSPYLKKWNQFHNRFGTKVVLNLFYSTPKNDFDLSKFPDTYKEEWQANAHWLKLAFHARSEFPDHPFLNIGPDQLLKDMDQIENEIARFAGPESYTRTDLLHWGSIRPENLKVLIGKGFKTLSGSNWPIRFKNGEYLDKYQVPASAIPYFEENDSWYNYENGLLFGKIDLCCNRVPLDQTLDVLRKSYYDKRQKEVMNLGTHEQYFWPFYKNYMKDHWDRVELVLRFMLEHNYQPILPEEDPWNALVLELRKKK